MDLLAVAEVNGVRRRLLRIPTPGGEVLLTCHEPPTAGTDVAIVLANFGPVPRAGVGDVAVRCADALAEHGWTVYRADLPGLGDVPGELPLREEPYFRALQDGAAGADLVAVADAVCAGPQVRQVVLGGLCSGAWTAMHAARARTASVAGLLLIEPELRRVAAPDDAQTAAPVRRGLRWFSRRVLSPSAWLRAAGGGGDVRLGRGASLLRPLARLLLGTRLPGDVDVDVVRLWQRLAARGLPALVVTVGRGWRESYVEQLMHSTPRTRFTHRSIEGTNHVFTAGAGGDALVDAVLAWLADERPGMAA